MASSGEAITLCVLLLVASGCYAGTTLCSCSNADANGYIQIETAESFPEGQVLTHLNITGDNSQISLSLTANEFLVLNKTSRDLIVAHRLEVTGTNDPMIFQVVVNCKVLLNTQVIPLHLIITIRDTNDHAPIFQTAPYAVNVSEAACVGSTVFSGLNATDLDPSDEGHLSYSIVNDNPYSSFFNIPVPSTGIMILMKKLDYDQERTINLTVVVKDNSLNLPVLGAYQPQYTSTTSVIVMVRENPDDNPIFTQSTYTTSVNYDANPGTVLQFAPPIGAYFMDATLGNLTYSLIEDPLNDDWKQFSVDHLTGMVTTAGILQYGQHIFQIRATKTSNRNRYGTAVVRVSVTQPVVFAQKIFNYTLVENCPVGTYVTRLTVSTGNAQNTELAFSFVDKQTSVYFGINDTSGDVLTTKLFDSRAAMGFNMTVQVSDKTTGQTDTASLLVNILKVSMAVEFSQTIYTFNISKNTNVVGQVRAMQNPEGAVVYRLLDNSNCFSVNNDGMISFSSSCSLNSLFNSAGSSHTMAVIAEGLTMYSTQNTSLVIVVNPNAPTAAAASSNSPSSQAQPDYTTVVIVIAIIGGVLLLIIAILIIYIYRKSCKCSEDRCCLVSQCPGRASAAGRVEDADLAEASVKLVDFARHDDNPPEEATRPNSDISKEKDTKFGYDVASVNSHASRTLCDLGSEVAKDYGTYMAYTPSNDEYTLPHPPVLCSLEYMKKLRMEETAIAPYSVYSNRGLSSDTFSEYSSGPLSPMKHIPGQLESNKSVSSGGMTSSKQLACGGSKRNDPSPPPGHEKPPKHSNNIDKYEFDESVEDAYCNSEEAYSKPKKPPKPASKSIISLLKGSQKSVNSKKSDSPSVTSPPGMTSPPAKLLVSNVSFVDRPEANFDYNSSQETFSQSMMTLTRPAVGTNGITVYY